MNNTNFYKNDGNLGNQPKMYSSCTKILITISSITGLVSVLVLIALNITNLSVMISGIKGYNKQDDVIIDIKREISQVSTSISQNVNPRLNIITSATSYTLPTLISSQVRNIRNDIYQYCTPKFDTPTGSCPVSPNPRHEGSFMLYDPDSALKCNSTYSMFKSITTFSFIPFASFIPSPTLPSGCVRIPTFSLSDSIYSYSHNILHTSCADSSQSSQYWSIGKIVPGQNNTPVFQEIVNWYLNDGKNRKSCVTVASENGAWLACNIVTLTEREDYQTPGIMDVFIGYMDVFGKKYSWFFNSNSFPTDTPYNALYFSVGSGIIKDGRVYMLMYGGLTNPKEGNAYCQSPGCANPNQQTCNSAQKPTYFYGKQILNGILSFDDSVDQIPDLTYRTINPQYLTIGAEGRLYYYPHMNKTFIYLRSSTWHSLLQYGEIDLSDPITINWYPYETFTRPSSDPCSSANRCPQTCIGGVYTDFFLLSPQKNLGISVMLTGGKIRRGPQIRIADVERVYFYKDIINQNQEAWYTTTTCFLYYGVPWCISIVEMKPGSIGYMEPVSLLYPLWGSCKGSMMVWRDDDLE
nr:receptor binding protein [Paramyxoviridae sp.]